MVLNSVPNVSIAYLAYLKSLDFLFSILFKA